MPWNLVSSAELTDIRRLRRLNFLIGIPMVFMKSTLVLLIALATCIGDAASQIQPVSQSDTSNVGNSLYNNGVMVQSNDGSNWDGLNQNGITTTTSQIQRDSFSVESGRQNSNTDVVISNAETGPGSKGCNEKVEVRTSFSRGSPNQFADGDSLGMEKLFETEKDQSGASQRGVFDRQSSMSSISGTRYQPHRSYVVYRPEYAMMNLESDEKDSAVSVTNTRARFSSYSGVADGKSSSETSRFGSAAKEGTNSYYDRLVSGRMLRNRYPGDKALQVYVVDDEAANTGIGRDQFYTARQNSVSSSTGRHGKPGSYVVFENYAAPSYEKNNWNGYSQGRIHQSDGLNHFADKHYGNGYYYTGKDVNVPRFILPRDRRSGQFDYRGSIIENSFGMNSEDDMSYTSGAFSNVRQRGNRDIAGVNQDFGSDSLRNAVSAGKVNNLGTLHAADYAASDKDANAYSWASSEENSYKESKADMTVMDSGKSVFGQDDMLQSRYDSISDGISGGNNDVERFGRGGNVLRIYGGNGFGVYSRNGGERDNFRNNILNRYSVENSKMQFYEMPYAGYEDGRSMDAAVFDGSRYVYGNINGKDRMIINGDDYQGYGYGLLNSNAIRPDADSTGTSNHDLVYEKDIYSNGFYDGRFDGNGYGLIHPCSSEPNSDIMNCSDCLEEYYTRIQW